MRPSLSWRAFTIYQPHQLRETEGGGEERERGCGEQRGRERWMYQTAAPCWEGNGKAAGTNMNISADSCSSLYYPPSPCLSVSRSLSLIFSFFPLPSLLTLQTTTSSSSSSSSCAPPHTPPSASLPLYCLLIEWTVIIKGGMELESGRQRRDLFGLNSG